MDAVAQLNSALAGRYAIDREIGAGGMATVYLARDIKHARHVALKVLNPELGAVLGVERFLSEIRVTANLQHPNLLPLFDSGVAREGGPDRVDGLLDPAAAGGLLFYVMPFVDGESLRARLSREKQLPIDAAVHIAVSAASALDYAHSHGVVHRDLKPENILIQSGEPVVADFGIALAVSNAGGARITQTGLSLGTPQYMSPEQATGDRAVDGRTDVYSLGAVLYEMLVGDPPHVGSTVQAIVAKVLTETPQDVRVHRPSVPRHVSAAVNRALQKLPADRWATAREFAEALQGRGVTVVSEVPGITGARRAAEPKARRWSDTVLRFTPWAISAAAIIAFARLKTQGPTSLSEAQPMRFSITPSAGERVVPTPGWAAAISPDGRTIAWIGESPTGRRLYMRDVNDLSTRVVPGSDGATSPFFSPDSKWIGIFTSSGPVKTMRTTGGPLTTVTTVSPDGNAFGVAWTSTGKIIVGHQVGFRGLSSASAAGGAIQPLTKVQKPTDEHEFPVALDDGKTLVFTVSEANAGKRLAIGSIETGQYKTLDIAAAYAVGVALNELLYVRQDGTLMAVPIDVEGRRTTGDPVSLIDGLQLSSEHIGLTTSGSLLYVRGTADMLLVMADEHGATRKLLEDRKPFRHPRFSPDGTRIVVDIAAGQSTDVWMFDIASKTLSKFAENADRPEWSPDGKYVLFRHAERDTIGIWRERADNSAPSERLLSSTSGPYEGVLTPDGNTLVYRIDTGPTKRDIYYASLSDPGTPHALAATPADELMPRLSPDGHWLAYTSDESGRYEIYLRQFPGPSGKWQVSDAGGTQPVWGADGRHLFYRNERELIAAVVDVAGGSMTVRSRSRLFSGDFAATGVHASFDVARSGREFLMVQPAGENPLEMVLAANWIAELREKMRATR